MHHFLLGSERILPIEVVRWGGGLGWNGGCHRPSLLATKRKPSAVGESLDILEGSRAEKWRDSCGGQGG